MKKKRSNLPKSDALLTPGYVARLRNCSDQTVINAISAGKIKAAKVYSSKDSWAWAVRWGDVRAFAARGYSERI